jgi:hypothetical protein
MSEMFGPSNPAVSEGAPPSATGRTPHDAWCAGPVRARVVDWCHGAGDEARPASAGGRRQPSAGYSPSGPAYQGYSLAKSGRAASLGP